MRFDCWFGQNAGYVYILIYNDEQSLLQTVYVGKV